MQGLVDQYVYADNVLALNTVSTACSTLSVGTLGLAYSTFVLASGSVRLACSSFS